MPFVLFIVFCRGVFYIEGVKIWSYNEELKIWGNNLINEYT